MARILTFIVILNLLVFATYGEVLFKEDFAGTVPSNAQGLSKSLDFKFHQESGGSIQIKDYDGGVKFSLADNIADGSVYSKLYISFCLRSENESVKEKYAGLVFYNDGGEVFGLGNDYFSENYSCWKTGGEGIDIGSVPTKVDWDVHKIVMEVDFDSDGPEKILVGLDPFCIRSQSRQPEHIWSKMEYELSFDEMRIRCGNNDCVWQFDEVVIGTEWEDVCKSDDNPGEYIQNILSRVAGGSKEEKVGEGVYRFWNNFADISNAAQSFIFDNELISTGSVPSSFETRPSFATVGDTKYVYFDIDAETDLYGTGEVTGELLRNGYKVVLFNKDCYAYGKPDQLYQSHPWVMGVRQDGTAFGIIFDTTWKSELDLRAGVLFSVPADAVGFPVVVIDGKSPQDVMLKLADLTGTMPMPPKWSLGFQQCRYSYYPDARARQIVDTFRAKQIPCDVLWFDIDYMDGFRIFTFDKNYFPDPKATNDYLHAAGFKSVWMIDPGVKNDPEYFIHKSGSENDVWVKDASGGDFVGPVWPGDCVFPDFTVPSVRLWWSNLYKDFMANGIDGVWNDMNEPSVFKDELEGTMALDAVHRGGGDIKPGKHVQYHNVYGLLMVKASREGIEKANPDKRPFVLSRANFLGGQKYAATWTGDNTATWKHMKMSIPMSLNLSLSGQPFNGPDIGGFVGEAEPELWANWISVGAFFPFSRAHTSTDTGDQEPWSFGMETENAARTALSRRYLLMPYLYTLFKQAHETGMPIMRPVFFADPGDISLRQEDQAFLLGDDLMVIPKWAKDVKCPKGIWRNISVDNVADDKFQCELKAKGGSIITVGPKVQCTDEIAIESAINLVIVPDDEGIAEGILYEDAGQGYSYLEGEYRLTKIKAYRQRDDILMVVAEQEGKLAMEKRLVSVEVVTDDGKYRGFGDICDGIRVHLNKDAVYLN